MRLRPSEIHRGCRERETRFTGAARLVWLAVCAGVIATIAACATVPYTGRRQLSIVSDEEEIGEGAQNRLGNGPFLPPAMGAGLTEELVQSGIGQGGQGKTSKRKARLDKAALR